jgi:hypothetical protein
MCGNEIVIVMCVIVMANVAIVMIMKCTNENTPMILINTNDTNHNSNK